jgi:hypothetical protein
VGVLRMKRIDHNADRHRSLRAEKNKTARRGA